MKRVIDIDAILAPIPGDNPAGEDLRYNSVYDEIKEARRTEDALDRGDWQSAVKRADWDRVIKVSVETLTGKTKDLQIAAWLLEALIKTEGFEGLYTGLAIVNGLLRDFWEHVYPEIEEGDLDFRAAPVAFINDKLWLCIKEIPLTDAAVTPGYSWLKWQESREVGYESDTLNPYGDVDEDKKKRRQELIAEGKLTAEEFDSSVALSSKAYYRPLAESLGACREEFKRLDQIVDEKFGREAPRLAEFGKSLGDCEYVVTRILKEKKEREPDLEPEQPTVSEGLPTPSVPPSEPEPPSEKAPPMAVPPLPVTGLPGAVALEENLWNEALQIMQANGIREALGRLLEASSRAPSVREKNRCRLLMAKLCLRADRPDLARPIVEELYALIEELHLERWESPRWIAEVLAALYQCLTKGEPSDDDISKAGVLFQRLCTTDVTQAITFKS
jgi:type VI secretion system protein ImpA